MPEIGIRHFKRLHLEPVGGVAGDMLLAALLDLGAERLPVDRMLASVGADAARLELERVELGTESALSIRSIAREPEARYRHLAEIEALLDRLDISATARRTALGIYRVLVAAEAAVHGGTLETVHLHEVGQLDSVLDVVGIAVALDALGNPEVTCSPLPSGSGEVQTAHGVLSVPVPAVREIAGSASVPLVAVPVEGETVTPTGIAVVAEVASRFCERPAGPPAASGAGAGTRRFSDRPNVVRVFGYW